jgi:hypothetical protein
VLIEIVNAWITTCGPIGLAVIAINIVISALSVMLA